MGLADRQESSVADTQDLSKVKEGILRRLASVVSNDGQLWQIVSITDIKKVIKPAKMPNHIWDRSILRSSWKNERNPYRCADDGLIEKALGEMKGDGLAEEFTNDNGKFRLFRITEKGARRIGDGELADFISRQQKSSAPDAEEIEKLQEGILRRLASVTNNREELWQTVPIGDIKKVIKPFRMPNHIWDRSIPRERWREEINPYRCTDDERIEQAVNEMRDNGLVEAVIGGAQGVGKHWRFRITEKGARLIHDNELAAFIVSRLTNLQQEVGSSETSFSASVRPKKTRSDEESVSMSQVEQVLSAELGRDSPLTRRLLQAIRGQGAGQEI